jgi:hypothetical protein
MAHLDRLARFGIEEIFEADVPPLILLVLGLAEKKSHLLRVPLSFELFLRGPSPYPLVIEPAQEPVAE